MPFFIDWLECDNPKDTNPLAGQFESLSIATPDAQNLSAILEKIGLEIPVHEGEKSLSVTVSGNYGKIILSSTPETSQIRIR